MCPLPPPPQKEREHSRWSQKIIKVTHCASALDFPFLEKCVLFKKKKKDDPF